MVPLAVPTVALTIALLALGEWGANLAQVIGLPFAIYAAASAIFARREHVAYRAPVSTRRKIAVGALTLLVGAVLPAFGWLWYDRYADVDVRFGSASVLGEGESVTVNPKLARSQWRGELTFTPALSTDSTPGDCVLPARLMITTVVDGQRIGVTEARHGVETAITIPDGVEQVELNLLVKGPPDQECVLTVALTHAVLHRVPW
ncbi:hypothetical protein Pen02_15630 [Plantactinospora endophytica]|uniref:Uncharacterized protein n=2 Tax=Plantactinospora endophytica TaxID=673535 RepID=A0ABQ4DX21_9ACTN|nr:hypothetical protein Pen02_15630 [Plantactinospora endophytica]